MNQLIKINNTDLSVKEFNGQRVVTFKDIDMLHERVEGTAGRNFRENKNHLIENEDYFFIKGNELKSFKQATNFVGSNAKEIILITESGYLMLAKSLQDDLAWKVQRELVNNYFRVKEISKKSKEEKTLKEKAFDIISELPNDKYKNRAVVKLLQFVGTTEEDPATTRSKILRQDIDVKEILNKFIERGDGILKKTEYGLALEKEKLYKHFSKYGLTKTETLRELDNIGLIPHEFTCRTPLIRYKGDPIRVVIININ